MPVERKCGTCRECCIALEVKSVDKPAGDYCRHLCKVGCVIYEVRPDECRTYNCLWLEGVAPRWAKPNLTHAVPWRTGINSPDGSTAPVLRFSFNPHHKRNKRVMRWAKLVSNKILVLLSDGHLSEAMLDGEVVASRVGNNKDFGMEITVRDGKVIGIKVAP